MKLSAELNNFNNLELELILLKWGSIMVQQETRLKVADNTGAKRKFFASELWVDLQEDMQISVM